LRKSLLSAFMIYGVNLAPVQRRRQAKNSRCLFAGSLAC
jgi:hypothetical protein